MFALLWQRDHAPSTVPLDHPLQETVVNFAKRCGQIIDLAMDWTPQETKSILEVIGIYMYDTVVRENFACKIFRQ